jgi:trk system potassium uptake protein TrkA
LRIIVIGSGILGLQVAKKLSEEGHDVVVVDIHEDELRRAQDVLDVGVVRGKGSTPSVLLEAGITSADMIVAVTGSDETNIVACLIAETLSQKTVRVARLRDPAYLGTSGIIDQSSLSIDLVISPEEETARRIELLARTPGASDVLEFAGGRVKAIGVQVDAGSPMEGRPLKELSGHSGPGVLVAGVYRGEMVSAPSGDLSITAGDTLFLVAAPGSVRRVLTRLGKEWVRTRHVLISGGGREGAAIAHRLAAGGIHTKIIERDQQLCESLAQQLESTTVLHGDGLDRRLLIDEGVQRADLFVAASADEKENVFAALLAKRLGARRVVSLVDTAERMPFAFTMGVDVVLSPMLAALSPILQFVRRGRVVSVSALREGLVEGIEFIAVPGSDIVGLPLALLHMPRGSLVGSIVRGDEVIIPHGDTVIEADDRVILFARPHLIPRLQRLLAAD